MRLRIIGGPYDGSSLTAVDLERHLAVLALSVRGGVRRFLYLPDPADWPAVLAGRSRVADSAAFHYYELVGTPAGPALEHDPCGERYRATVAAATREMPDRNGHGSH